MTELDLQQLAVLVTRPAHQAEGLCHLIEQAGGQAIRLPVIEIVGPADEIAARASLAELADFDIVIFISANAVRQCCIYIGKDLPVGPQFATVGQGTARQLQEDFQRQADLVPESGFNSEALLAMPAFQLVDGQRILIVKGQGGRTILGETLADRGANLSYANLYRRMIPTEAESQFAAIQQAKVIDVVVLTSGEGITNLLSLAGDTGRSGLCSIPWLVIHPRLAEIAQAAGCNNEIIISAGPGDEEILCCIRQWVQQKIKGTSKNSLKPCWRR